METKISNIIDLLMSEETSAKWQGESMIQSLNSAELCELYNAIWDTPGCGFGKVKRRSFATWFLNGTMWMKDIEGKTLDQETDRKLVEILDYMGGPAKMQREFPKIIACNASLLETVLHNGSFMQVYIESNKGILSNLVGSMKKILSCGMLQ